MLVCQWPAAAPGALALTHTIRILDAKDRIEHVHLRSAEAAKAIALFRDGKAALVLGGTFVDLPSVPRGNRNLRNALRFEVSAARQFARRGSLPLRRSRRRAR